ncbi:MAG TPA: metalloregulator ArsR/SmtB family transcription factor [Ktedonobacterales bacterium]|nr:metalloregulator ArsR/SmtB family transcription factor [Ktedonobacterales bacterium]
MDLHVDTRQTGPRAVDLRRARTPDISIVACGTYDFLLSLHVVLASPDVDYADYDIGREWIKDARRACAARDASALETLGHYLGDGQPGSLHSTLISLVAQCPEPRDTAHFLNWLAQVPVTDVVETLLDQDGLGADWPDLLHATLALGAEPLGRDESVTQRLLARYPADLHDTVSAVLHDPERARVELIAALHAWNEAVFAAERARILPLLEREAAALERQRAELPTDRFLKLAMRGVEWQRPAGLRRILFAPSYFCRPAVFYHFWHGILTFCYPVDAHWLESEASADDPRAPSEETLRFFEALGDATRLRILHFLAEREMYLTELSERLGLTKATTKHHMVRLRAAGLVTLYDRDRMTFYALRADVTRHAAQLLDEYLGRRP